MVLALAVLAGCGDDDDGSSSASGGSGSNAADAGSTGDDGGEVTSPAREAAEGRNFTGDAADINEALIGIQEDFDKVDGESYCGRLTTAGIRQVETFGKAYGNGTNCVGIMNTVAKNTREAGVVQKPSVLLKVKVNGDRAVATISNGGRPPEPMIFVKQGGEWKIPDPGFAPDAGEERRLSSDPEKRAKQVEQVQKQVEKQRKAAQKRLQSGQ